MRRRALLRTFLQKRPRKQINLDLFARLSMRLDRTTQPVAIYRIQNDSVPSILTRNSWNRIHLYLARASHHRILLSLNPVSLWVSGQHPCVELVITLNELARPTVQPSTTHSRLVTTKLTAGLQSSSASSPSWSRPSSATPPVPPTSSSLPSVPAPVPSATAPQLPHAGKVIQPQPRTTPSSASAGGSQKDGSGNNKPAWGDVKTAPTHTHNATARAQNAFPTAAEVAQGILRLPPTYFPR